MSLDDKLFPINATQNKIADNIKKDGSVAIIMRIQNSPILFARAIESVLQQTYTNWHLYIINNGSITKEVDDIIELYKRDINNRLTLIHNSHSLCMEVASNCGFSLATEEFMVVHDDDSWDPAFLLETVQFLQENLSAVAVITNYFVVNEEIRKNTAKQISITECSEWKDLIDISILICHNVAPPISILIRMNVAKQIGKFNEELPTLGDWDYLLRLFRAGEIKTLNKKLAYYHHRSDKQSSYGNSVISDLDNHLKYKLEYKNALARKALLADQGNYGILHLLLSDNNSKNKEHINLMIEQNKLLNQRIDKLQNHVVSMNNVIAEQNKLLNLRIDMLQNSIVSMNNFIFKIQDNIAYLRKKSFPIKRFSVKIRMLIRKLRNK